MITRNYCHNCVYWRKNDATEKLGHCKQYDIELPSKFKCIRFEDRAHYPLNFVKPLNELMEEILSGALP